MLLYNQQHFKTNFTTIFLVFAMECLSLI